MKNIITYVVVILVIVGGIFGGYYYYSKNKSKNDAARTSQIKKEDFIWGVTMRPHALAKYTAKSWAAQMVLTKELGVKYVRIAWQYDAKPDPFKFTDTLMKETDTNNLQVYMIIENKTDLKTVANPYKDGYDSANAIAAHYKGKIKYYQLLNEAGSSALKGGQYTGENESDYDKVNYGNIKEWLKGAADGIKAADPNAYRIISDQWTHFAFFDMIKRDGVNYDIIGWDWFSDMGFMGDKKLSSGKTVLERLQEFGKPLILAEVNYRPTGPSNNQQVDGAKQSAFMSQMAEWAYNTKAFKAFFILELMDVTNTGTRGYTDRYGIVEANKNAKGVGEITGKRPAFDALKAIIQKYTK